METGGEQTADQPRSLAPETIRVLHVDDEPDFGELVATFLEREDDRFVVESATSASEGLDRLDADEYDCVVSDYDMPGTDGIEFLEEIRCKHPQLPFVLFTGKGSEEVASDAISAGVTDYLQKNTGTDQYTVLANRIENAVGHFHAEQELERQNDLFRKAQDLADVGAWEYDAQREELTWTEQVYEIHDLSPTFDPTPETAIGYYHPEDRGTMRDVFERAVEDGEPYDIEVRLLTDADEQCWVRTRGQPQLDDGEVIRIRGTVQDVTEQKQRERELKRQNDRFDEFATVLSHDLETPLTTARTRAEVALETGDEHHLEATLAALDRVDELRADLAEVLRSRQLVEQRSDVSTATMIEEAWDTLEVGPDASLDVADPPRVRGDPDALKRCFENLLSNALEHCGESVTVRVGRTDDDLYIEDDGPGIAPDRREDLFTAGASTKPEGSGMGLTSVRQIVHAHGWEIQVTDPQELGGARFELTDVDIVE